ncbi:HGxxPAAW family protein [Nocardiopsis ansamitocini]|uniref:Uncharacterized protein n=1 Tax=Nocardiopsis ansamitocini TaxID=1670832 RepID=A0A9W6P2G2_9ACTN|nr:HGxxPAAW family protein [Nocardiopsis ansamitocini]GLU45928.1 hypothetical protein Nans01_02790 [Nocardiopsis ansamitocini]
MSDEHHDDHGNTLSAWFLTASWIVIWTVAGVAIIAGQSLITWTIVALVGSIACAAVAGVMKRAGLGRKTPRPLPMTREQYDASLLAKTKDLLVPERQTSDDEGDEPASRKAHDRASVSAGNE